MKKLYFKLLILLSLLFLLPFGIGVAASNNNTPLITKYVKKQGFYYPQLKSCQPQTDQFYQQKLIGDWVIQAPETKDDIKFTFWITYEKDGKWHGAAIAVNGSDNGIVATGSGTWKVKDGKLYETIKSMTVESMVGKTKVSDLICMGDNQFKAKLDGKTTYISLRVLRNNTNNQ